MTQLKVTPLFTLANGYVVAALAEAGSTSYGRDKQGNAITLTHAAGSVMLLDDADALLCGPIGLAEARALAVDLLEGRAARHTPTITVALLAMLVAVLIPPGEVHVSYDITEGPMQ